MMPYFTPLIIVFASMALLWVVGRLLSRVETKTETVRASKVRGTEFAPGLHVAGLSDESINEMNALINAKDIGNLSVFLALKKPSLIELDEYIETLRQQFLEILKKPLGQASEIERIAATSQLNLAPPPPHFDFTQLNKTELRELVEYDAKKRRLINHEFISKFGDNNFMENFTVYAELVKDIPVTLLIEEGDKYRKQIDVFVTTGVALRGRKIPLQDRLSVLKFSQLRDMAKELKLEQEFKRRADATQILAEIPGSAILLAMLVNIDDIFMIKPQAVDIDAINSEWSVVSTYAKLLCHHA